MTIAISGTNGITLDGQFNSASSMGFKNRIINGAMVIDQRNAGASVTPVNNQYTLDRYYGTLTQASKYTVQQNAGSVTPPVGFTKYLGVTSSSAYSVLTGDTFAIVQVIEGFNIADLAYGTASAATVTLSFQVRSSLTGTFGGALVNGAQNRSYPFTYTISSANTWTQISVTIAGDTTGTWTTDNTAGLLVRFGLGSGATYSGTAGAWAAGNFLQPTSTVSVVGTNGATFYITGVQLEKGSTATSFDYLDYGRSLIQCQRYFQKESYVVWSGNATNGSIYYTSFEFPVQMRAAPTMTYSNVAASGFPATASTTNQVTASQVSWQRTSNGTTNGAYYAEAPTMSAEL
jgi:hypothetical protein